MLSVEHLPYEVRGKERVQAYVDQHEELVPFLYELRDVLIEHFGLPVRVALEVYEWDEPILFAIVVSPRSRAQADEQFWDFCCNWWQRRSDDFFNIIDLDMEYTNVDQ